ncbi:hypothetical protein B7P43_G14460, partial [Cryptotermes secundus]
FRTQYGHQPPTRKRILFWDNKLRTTGSLLLVKSPGKTRTSEENVNRMREAFQQSPPKSICDATLQLSPNFLRQVCFSDEATFHVNAVVNRCSFWIFVVPPMEPPLKFTEEVIYSKKMDSFPL